MNYYQNIPRMYKAGGLQEDDWIRLQTICNNRVQNGRDAHTARWYGMWLMLVYVLLSVIYYIIIFITYYATY